MDQRSVARYAAGAEEPQVPTRFNLQTIRDLIDRMAERQPMAPFLLAADTGQVVTFKKLQDDVRSLYHEFRHLGLAPGDKVALLMDNGVFSVELFFAAMYGGFVSVPLNVRAGVPQLAYMLDHCDAKVVYVSNKYDALIKQIIDQVQRPIGVIHADLDACQQKSVSSSAVEGLPRVEAEDPALLMYTSGSTGLPRAPLHTHKSILAHSRVPIRSHHLTAADRALLVLPIYHANAESVTLIPTLLSGGSVVIPSQFMISDFWDLMENYGCTWCALVPTIISQLMDWKDPTRESPGANLQRVRFLRTSSGPMSPSLHREFVEKLKLPLIQAMGFTEAGVVFANPSPPGEAKVGSVGLPWEFAIKIVDANGQELAAGQAGEVLIRGDGMMQCYYKDPVGTAAALDAQGWLHTGDLAHRDEDGYMFVVGRSKELIIKGGMNIAPRQIDEVLETHPMVSEAAAVGVPDRYVGEDLVAFAVLRSEMSCDERELLQFCESRLGHFKTPTRIYFVQDLPKGPSGKVQRLRLVEEAERLAVANSFPLASGSDLPAAAPAATDLALERIITGIWSELLAQPKIDPQSNFFALGGQSLLAIQYLSRLRNNVTVMLSLSDFFENPTVTQQVALVRKRMFGSPASETAGTGQLLDDLQPIPPRDRALPCPLSPAQERLWFMEQLGSGVPAYNEADAVRLSGKIDLDVLEQALNTIVARHEILRTTIEVEDGQPVAIVHENWPLQIEKINLRQLSSDQHKAELARLLVDEPRRLYHLETEPGIRATVIELDAEEHVFILMMHHIICDRLSVGVLWRELGILYNALLHGRPSPLPPLPIQYGDYAAWQRHPRRQARFNEDLSFWKENLRGAPTVLDLPADRTRPAIMSYIGNKRRFQLDPDLTKDLRELCRREQISLFNVFAAALNTLLYRYTGQDDILIGIPIADRDRPELQPLIGFLIDTQVLRTNLKGNPTFRELLARVQQGVVDVYSHRSIPFDQIVAGLKLNNDGGYSPLFQVLLNWRDRDAQLQSIGLTGVSIEPLLAQCKTSKFDVTVILTDAGDSIHLEFEYSTDLFDESRIERMFGHLDNILRRVVTNAEQRLSDLPLLTVDEQHRLLQQWNSLGTSDREIETVHELFERQVERTPDAVAIVDGVEQFTYLTLRERVNALVEQLRALGLRDGQVVALSLPRGARAVSAMLAIMRCGCAFLPIDSKLPEARREQILRIASAELLVTGETIMRLPGSELPSLKRSAPESTAYVLFTSGSTGVPKAVCVPHRAVVRLVCGVDYVRLDPNTRMLHLAPLSFDASVLEIWGALLNGGTLVVYPNDLPELAELGMTIAMHRVTTAWLTSSLFNHIIDTSPEILRPLRELLTGGEALSVPHVVRALSHLPDTALINGYGPTEAATFTTTFRIPRDFDATAQRVPIGRCLPRTQVYLLDEYQQLVPLGIPGEIYIGGSGVAIGYLGDSTLTTAKFLPDKFAQRPGALLYRTGDFGCFLADGNLDFLGRRDNQVKIRGFRIELGEIETVLSRHPAVGDAAVVASENSRGEKQLVAYVTAKGSTELNLRELRDFVKQRLPHYMIPLAFFPLRQLPLLPTGKLDRKALPAPEKEKLGNSYPAAITDSERLLCQIWGKWLNIDDVRTHDNFFDLGGHSILALRVVGEINKKLKTHLRLAEFFQNPVVEDLARIIERNYSSVGAIRGCRPSISRLLENPTRAGIQSALSKSIETQHGDVCLFLIYPEPSLILMAEAIEPLCPIFAVDTPWPASWRDAASCNQVAGLPTMQDLAARLIAEIEGHSSKHRIVLAGHSAMGVVAFEVAHQLKSRGVELECVMLLDTWLKPPPHVYVRYEELVNRWKWQYRNLQRRWYGNNIDGDEKTSFKFLRRIGYISAVVGWVLGKVIHFPRYYFLPVAMPAEFRAGLPTHIYDEENNPLEWGVVENVFDNAKRSYQETPLDCHGILFKTSPPEEKLRRSYDETLGWKSQFMKGLEIVLVQGDHLSLIRSDLHRSGLSSKLSMVLKRLQGG
jgi:amino acid adenylation domain-containing protein